MRVEAILSRGEARDLLAFLRAQAARQAVAPRTRQP
jgi:hypothetical protein